MRFNCINYKPKFIQKSYKIYIIIIRYWDCNFEYLRKRKEVEQDLSTNMIRCDVSWRKGPNALGQILEKGPLKRRSNIETPQDGFTLQSNNNSNFVDKKRNIFSIKEQLKNYRKHWKSENRFFRVRRIK